MSEEKKIPPPPINNNPLFVPLNFWMDVIAYMDKRIEIASNSSGYGMVEMSIKIFKGRIYEVNFGEKLRVREIVSKAGEKGSPNPEQKSSVVTDE